MRILAIILVALALTSCGQWQGEAMFERHVYFGKSSDIHNLRSGKLGCMNCPMYFRFNSSPEAQRNIIEAHGLTEVGSLPEVVSGLNRTIAAEVDWWDQNTDAQNAKIFLVNYMPQEPSGERVFRAMIVAGENTYFITTGYFNEAHYVREKA